MKWTDEQKKALRESIAHWEQMREYRKPLPDEYEKPWAESCECCRLFDRDDCAKCPIPNVSGKANCRGTPFWEANGVFFAWLDGLTDRRTWVRAATKEIDFLKKVLEAGK